MPISGQTELQTRLLIDLRNDAETTSSLPSGFEIRLYTIPQPTQLNLWLATDRLARPHGDREATFLLPMIRDVRPTMPSLLTHTQIRPLCTGTLSLDGAMQGRGDLVSRRTTHLSQIHCPDLVNVIESGLSSMIDRLSPRSPVQRIRTAKFLMVLALGSTPRALNRERSPKAF